ncbi:conserved hypothetical protein [Thiocapsa sp. KS1]|nr:hypothetical protein [Thiocapsa sp. KS1]CRI63925.1 conserved hypothetical protein [Thiocapsa sp. KS1]
MATKKPVSKPIRILKLGTCPSLSGASNLIYHVGYDTEIHVRIWGNSGGGLFGREWVSLASLQASLETDKPVTAGTLKRAGVCKGKSANTPGFLLAVLKTEGLVEPLEQGGHTKADPSGFLTEIGKLIDDGTDIQVPPTKATR